MVMAKAVLKAAERLSASSRSIEVVALELFPRPSQKTVGRFRLGGMFLGGCIKALAEDVVLPIEDNLDFRNDYIH